MPLRILVFFLLFSLLFCLPGCSGGKKPEARTYRMGDRVELGKLAYTVYDTQWLTQIGDGVAARVPQHRFFLVRMSISNGAGTHYMAPAIVLYDDHGQTFGEISNGDGVPQWMGLLRQVNPGEAIEGNLVFDVPPAHYKIRVADEEEHRTAFVDLPLSFNSSVPNLPPPAPK